MKLALYLRDGEDRLERSSLNSPDDLLASTRQQGAPSWLGCKKLMRNSIDYWVKAQENLEMALLAYQRKKYNVCASRAYYSVFLASISVLIELTDLRARDNEWDHGQVQAELNRRLIMRRKVLPGDIGRTPMDLIELRHVADYKPDAISTKEAKRACDRAERFLSSVASALEEKP